MIEDISQFECCKGCGKIFKPYSKMQKFHNDNCRIKFNNKRRSYYAKERETTKQCKQCNKEFKTNNKKKKYCNPECQVAHELAKHKGKEKRICKNPTCKKEFISAHGKKIYCSAKCRKIMRVR